MIIIQIKPESPIFIYFTPRKLYELKKKLNFALVN